MARRRNSALDFIQAFNGTYDTVGKVAQDFELSRVANAQPTTTQGFTAEQGDELRAAGEAGNHVGYDESTKGYAITPKLGEGEMGPAVPRAVAQQGITEFMGQRTAGTMDQDQINTARMKAMAGVISKYDPVAGMKLQREAKNDARDDQRYAWEKSRGEREMKKAEKDDAYEEGLAKEYGQTTFAQNMGGFAPQMQEYQTRRAEYDAQVQAGMPPQQLGQPPQAPARPGYSIAQSLADQGRLLAYKAQHGKADARELAAYAETYKKVGDEGYSKALKLAQAGAPIDKIASAFGESGDARLDPKNVVADRMVAGADGVASRVIDFRGEDGKVHSINVLAELDALGQADAYFNRFYKAEDNRRGNEQSALADKQLKESIRHNRASEGISARSARASMSARGDAKTEDTRKAEAGVALYLENNPQASKAQLEAVRRGILAAVPDAVDKNAPSEVKLAQSLLKSGLAPDQKSALKMAMHRSTQSPAETHREFVSGNLKAGHNAQRAVAEADKAMEFMGYAKKGVAWVQDEGDKPAAIPAPEQRTVGQTYDTPRGKMTWRGNGWEPAR